MVQKRPWQFNILIILYVLIIINFPLQILFIMNLDFSQFFYAFRFLTSLNWLVIVLLSVQIPMLMNGNKNLKITIPFSAFVVLANNYIVGIYSDVFSFNQIILSCFLYLIAHIVLLMPEPMAVLNNPKKRWWRTARRRDINVPASIEVFGGELASGITFNVSNTGVFMKLDPTNLSSHVGDKIKVYLGDKRKAFKGRLVRVSIGDNGHPKGIGIQFSNPCFINYWKLLALN